MKYLIAIPCMDTVPVQFMHSLLYVEKPEDTHVSLISGSLIYDSRNHALEQAVLGDYDRILWLDSDMTFEPDTMMRLIEDLDSGHEIVSGLYFKRRPPYTAVLFKRLFLDEKEGYKIPVNDEYNDYPKDSLFQLEGFGFGCVMMEVSAVKKIMEKYGAKLCMPVAGFGEDLSFCLRAKYAGVDLWCDSRIKCGHIGYYAVSEDNREALCSTK